MLEMVLENAVDEFEWAAVLIYYNTNIDDGQLIVVRRRLSMRCNIPQ